MEYFVSNPTNSLSSMKTTLLNSGRPAFSLTNLLFLAFFAIGMSFSASAQPTGSINSITNATCFGGNDGAVDINVSGGTAPYSFLWSNGASSEDLSGVTAGFYSVTITDAALATDIVNLSVGQPPQIVINRFTSDVSCNGGADGGISITVSGGASPYSYLWSNGDTSQNIANQLFGAFTVTVTDANGCVAAGTDTIGEPSQFFIFSSSTSPVSCFGGTDGAASLSLAGGILPYTFLWSNGATTQDLLNVPAGTYNVTATDNNGCKDFATVTVTEPPTAVSATFVVTNSSCFSSADGAIDMTVTGGIPPYTFLWNTSDTTEDLTGITQGSYTLTVTDANACVHVLNPSVSAIDSIPPVAICKNIDVYLSALGNASILSSDLDNGSTDNCGIGSFSADITDFNCANIGPNLVELVVFDSNGNSDTCNASVNVIDTIGPVMNLVNAILYLDATGQGVLSAAAVDNGTVDVCGLDTIILDQYNFNCADIGILPVEVTAIDKEGNTSVAGVNVQVIDTVSPQVITQNIAVFLDAAGMATITPGQVDNGSSDICGLDTMFLDVNTFDCSDIGIQSVLLTVVDAAGNSSSAVASVDVADNLAPQMVLNSTTVYLDATGQGVLDPMDLITSLSDNCALDTVTLDRYSFDCNDVGNVTIQVSTSDDYGNIQNDNISISIADTNKPFLFTQSAAVNLDAAGNGQINVSDVLLFASAPCGVDTVFLDKSNFTCTDVGQVWVQVTAISVNGAVSVDSAEVSVFDPVAPTILTNNAVVYLNDAGTGSLSVAQIDNGSSDACGIDSLYLNEQLLDCNQLGTFSVSLIGIDINGNTASASASVQVLDTVSPEITTQDLNVYLDNSGQASISPADVVTTSSDNCISSFVTLSKSVFNCTDVGVTSVTAVISDASGNTASSIFNVTVIDTVIPVVAAQNINLFLDANGTAGISPSDIDAGTATACGIDSLYLNQTLFDCSDLGTNVVVLTGIANNGQSTSDSAFVTVFDTVSPLLIVSVLDLYLDNAGMTNIHSASLTSIFEEACGIDSVYFSKEAFNCSDIGTNLVAFSISDVNGNVLNDNLIVEVRDTIAPNLSNQNISLYLDSTGNATITLADINTGSFDVCGMDTVYLDRYNFSCSDAGVNIINVVGVDLGGAVSSAPATVTVIDTNYPVAFARNRTIYVDDAGVAYLNPADVDNGSYDGNCGVILTLSDNEFDCGELGLNLVQLYVSDAAGNMDSADVFVTVKDTTKPELHLRNMTLSLDQNGQAWLNNASIFDSATTDNCTNVLAFSASKLQFDCSDVGSQNVLVTVIDNKLNAASAPVTVTIIDAALPQIVTRNATLYLGANGQIVATPQDIDNGSSDACGLDSLWLSQSVFTGNDLGGNTITLYGRDNSGLINSGIAIVNVVDTLSPVLNAQGVNLYLDATGQASLSGSSAAAAATDNHAISSFVASRVNFSCADAGANIISIVVFDPSGNRTSGNVSVMVLDTLAPVVTGSPTTVYLDASGNASISASDVNASATDNCTLKSISLNRNIFSCADLGISNIMLIGIDVQGNSDSIALSITVADTTAPMITNIPTDTVVFANDSTCGSVVTYPVPAVQDNCTFTNFSSSHASGSFFPIGTTSVVFTLNDASGNVATANFNVTVVDQSAPLVVSSPNNDTVGACQSSYYFQSPVGVDNCSGTTVTQILGIPSGGLYPVGTTINAFKIADDSGNDTIVSFYVVVEPIGQPNLPSAISVCENDDPVDLSVGQTLQWSGKGMDNNKFDPATAGTGAHILSFNFVDKNGCASTGTISIMVLPKPNKPVVNRIGSNTLTTGAFNTYQWYRDGKEIPGAKSQSLTYTTGGNYQVLVSNVSTCSDYSDGFTVGANGGGIGLDENALSTLDVYPNPSNGIITVDLNDYRKERLTMRVYSIAGQMVFESSENTAGTGQVRLDLTGLPKAAYMLQISSKHGQAVRQIIIQ